MSFAPVVPSSGLTGWSFLQRTQTAQKEILAQSPQFEREEQYFRDNIANVTTAADLVADRTLLRLSLTAFGLQDDVDNKYFIEKVLSDGVLSDDALANKLADSRYLELSTAFGFGTGEVLQTFRPGFADKIMGRALDQTFEIAVGDQDSDLRLALGLEYEISKIAEKDTSEIAKWYTILGTPTVRSVFEGALNLPSSVATIDIDKQLEIFRARSNSVFGTDKVTELASEEVREDLVRNYLLQQQIGDINIASSASNALTLLQFAS